MAASFLSKLRQLSFNCNRIFKQLFDQNIIISGNNAYLPALSHAQILEPLKSENDDTLCWNGLLFAVPRKRRSIQVNRTRRRSEAKRFKSFNNLVPCDECGFPKKPNVLCYFCYEKVREETKVIQDAMVKMFEEKNILPTKETAIVYRGESPKEEDLEKLITEVPKKRPSWFFGDLRVTQKQSKES